MRTRSEGGRSAKRSSGEPPTAARCRSFGKLASREVMSEAFASGTPRSVCSAGAQRAWKL